MNLDQLELFSRTETTVTRNPPLVRTPTDCFDVVVSIGFSPDLHRAVGTVKVRDTSGALVYSRLNHCLEYDDNIDLVDYARELWSVAEYEMRTLNEPF